LRIGLFILVFIWFLGLIYGWIVQSLNISPNPSQQQQQQQQSVTTSSTVSTSISSNSSNNNPVPPPPPTTAASLQSTASVQHDEFFRGQTIGPSGLCGVSIQFGSKGSVQSGGTISLPESRRESSAQELTVEETQRLFKSVSQQQPTVVYIEGGRRESLPGGTGNGVTTGGSGGSEEDSSASSTHTNNPYSPLVKNKCIKLEKVG